MKGKVLYWVTMSELVSRMDEEIQDEVLIESDVPVKTEQQDPVEDKDAIKIDVPEEEILDSLTLAAKIEPYKEKVNKDPFDQVCNFIYFMSIYFSKKDSWLVILFEIQSKSIETTRPYWEEFLKIYPTAVCKPKAFFFSEWFSPRAAIGKPM